MPCIVVVTHLDITDNNAGSPRRLNALLEAVPGTPLLIQARRRHPKVLTAPYPVDLGRRKVGINWGIFNLQWPRNARVMRAVVEHQAPAALACGSIFEMMAVRGFRDLPIFLDAHNVDAAYMEQQYGRGHPFARAVARVEREALRHARHVFACSDHDRSEFIARYGVESDRITVAPNGVDAYAFDGPPPPSPPDAFWGERVGDAPAVLFMGKLDYGPNREGLEFIRTDLAPTLRAAARPRPRIVVVGGPVPDGGRFPDEIVFNGPLPNDRLIAYVRSAAVCIAPIFSGSGTRLKVIETLAAGRPVVSTPKGAEGLGIESGRHALLAEREAFTAAVIDLLTNRDAAESMARRGQAYAREHFDFRTVIGPRWREVFIRLAPGLDGSPIPPTSGAG